MTPTDHLAADDAIVAEAHRQGLRVGTGDVGKTWLLLAAIADKRGRALRAIEAMHYEAGEGFCSCGFVWPCDWLARIREILGSQQSDAKGKCSWCGAVGVQHLDPCEKKADDSITAAKAHPAARGWTDTDDATIEEAKKRLERWILPDGARACIEALISIATRRGEENKKKAEEYLEMEAVNIRLVRERDALAEENEHLRRAARVADSGQITTEQALALAGLNKVEAEKQHARITALAEENRKLREALVAVVELGPELHEEPCPEDDTCDCRVVALVNTALSGGTE